MKQPVSVDLDRVVDETLQGLGVQLARAQLQANMARAENNALRARVEELEAAADVTEGDEEAPAG